MTVKELIAELQKYPKNLPIIFFPYMEEYVLMELKDYHLSQEKVWNIANEFVTDDDCPDIGWKEVEVIKIV